MSVLLEVAHSSYLPRPLTRTQQRDERRWSSFAGQFSGSITCFLPCQAPEPQPGARRLPWHSHRDAHRQNGCTEHSWFAVCSNSAHTLLEQPRRLRGAETAPLPFPTTASPGRGSEASAASRGRNAGEGNAVCRVRAGRCQAAHTRRGFGHKQSSPRGEAGQGAWPRHRGRLPEGKERPGLRRGSQRIAPEQWRARKAPGARTYRGSHPPGSHPRQRRDPPEAALTLLSPGAHRRGPGGEPAPSPAGPRPPRPPRPGKRKSGETGTGGRTSRRVSGPRLCFLFGRRRHFYCSRTAHPHPVTARRTRPRSRPVNVAAGGAVPRRAPGPAPAGRGRGARNRRALPGREGGVGSSCSPARPAGFIRQGKAARAVNRVVLHPLRVRFK